MSQLTMGNMLSSRVKGNLSRSVSDGRGVVVTLTSTLLGCQTKIPYKYGDIKFETVFDCSGDRYLLMILGREI